MCVLEVLFSFHFLAETFNYGALAAHPHPLAKNNESNYLNLFRLHAGKDAEQTMALAYQSLSFALLDLLVIA